MFEQTFVPSHAQTRRPWTVAVSLSIQFLVVAILLLIPLLHPQTLGIPAPRQPHLIRTWITQPPLPHQEATSRTATLSMPVTARPFVYVPPSTQPTAGRQVDAPAVESESTGWSGSSATGFSTSMATATELPPAIAVKPTPVQSAGKPTGTGPLKVSEGVEGAKLIFSPHPVYPQLAKTIHSQGVVKLEAIIAADGSIRNLTAVSGPPLLIDAALNAVRQWRYNPTLLNGVAVEVLTEIDITFTLNR
jgi:periplasmic protein TonB